MHANISASCAEKKSVWLQGQAEGIDALWRSLPSLDRGGDSAAVMLCICLSLERGGAPWPLWASCLPPLWLFVLVVYTLPYLSRYSSSPVSSVSAGGGLLHPRPTPAVIRRRVKAHAQMCNRFLCSLSRRDAIEPDGTVAFSRARKVGPGEV